MQFDYVAAAGGEVQSIDVLRDDAGDGPRSFQFGERPVPDVGLGARKPAPSDGRSRPVAPPHLRITQKCRMLNGGTRRYRAPGTAVIGDPRFGAAAGPGEHHAATIG